jgi:hypothetical protein
MEELQEKIKMFREARHPPGSPLMVELLEEVLAAYDKLEAVNLRDRKRETVRLLAQIQELKEAHERGDHSLISRSVNFYGIFAL